MDTTHHPRQTPDMQSPALAASGLLVLARHAESEWNVLGKWTGRTDVHLTAKGRQQAAELGRALQDIELHHVYTSEQIRTVETMTELLQAAGRAAPHKAAAALNERDYGEYTGLNKWEVLEQLGQDTFTQIRRSWDHPIPSGETLQMVYERAVPFYKEHILPKLLSGQNVLVVSHGNTLRSLIKYLEAISDADIAEVEMNFGELLLYRITDAGTHQTKSIRTIV
jgi:2,3-bisphosphoglycerate-dependent phosphoglycerate mutase